MKLFYLIVFLILSGCNQLLQGQQQPVKTIKNGVYYTTCGGAVETWASCNNKAQKTCNGSFIVLKEDQNSTGTLRELTFQCKK